MTRAASKQNFGAQPVTAITLVRDKFNKPRGNLMKSKTRKITAERMELEDDSFADAVLAASVPSFLAEHAYIGSPKNALRPAPNFGTPISELRARANAVRSALNSSLPQPPSVDPSLTGRECDIALEAERDFEPTIKDAISACRKKLLFLMAFEPT